jgi:hypothetical protein
MVGRVWGGRPEAELSVRRLPFPVRRMPLFEGTRRRRQCWTGRARLINAPSPKRACLPRDWPSLRGAFFAAKLTAEGLPTPADAAAGGCVGKGEGRLGTAVGRRAGRDAPMDAR